MVLCLLPNRSFCDRRTNRINFRMAAAAAAAFGSGRRNLSCSLPIENSQDQEQTGWSHGRGLESALCLDWAVLTGIWAARRLKGCSPAAAVADAGTGRKGRRELCGAAKQRCSVPYTAGCASDCRCLLSSRSSLGCRPAGRSIRRSKYSQSRRSHSHVPGRRRDGESISSRDSVCCVALAERSVGRVPRFRRYRCSLRCDRREDSWLRKGTPGIVIGCPTQKRRSRPEQTRAGFSVEDSLQNSVSSRGLATSRRHEAVGDARPVSALDRLLCPGTWQRLRRRRGLVRLPAMKYGYRRRPLLRASIHTLSTDPA